MHQTVEQVVEAPVPTTQEEIIHVPTVIHQHRHHHVEVKQVVDLHVPRLPMRFSRTSFPVSHPGARST